MKTKIKYLLRLDEDLKLYTARQARLNDRSLNQEINSRLRTLKLFEEYLKPDSHHTIDSTQDKYHLLDQLLKIKTNQSEIHELA